jgi:hypothetical protein
MIYLVEKEKCFRWVGIGRRIVFENGNEESNQNVRLWIDFQDSIKPNMENENTTPHINPPDLPH